MTMAANSHLAIDLPVALPISWRSAATLIFRMLIFSISAGSAAALSYVIASYTRERLTGTFNHVTTGYTVNYGTGTNSQITLNIPLSNVKGDFNNNGKVDAADYVLWRNNLGTNNRVAERQRAGHADRPIALQSCGGPISIRRVAGVVPLQAAKCLSPAACCLLVVGLRAVVAARSSPTSAWRRKSADYAFLRPASNSE